MTDRHELDEFLCEALLKDEVFEVEHSSMVILSTEAVVKVKNDNWNFEYQDLEIPRR